MFHSNCYRPLYSAFYFTSQALTKQTRNMDLMVDQRCTPSSTPAQHCTNLAEVCLWGGGGLVQGIWTPPPHLSLQTVKMYNFPPLLPRPMHNFKWVKITHICLICDQTFSNLDDYTHLLFSIKCDVACSAGIDFRRQILTSKVVPRAARLKIFLMAVDP